MPESSGDHLRSASGGCAEPLFTIKMSSFETNEMVAKAQLNISHFFDVLDLTDDEFQEKESANAVPSVGTVLGIPDEFLKSVKVRRNNNCTFGWVGLRGIFRRPWVLRHDGGFVARLLDGKIACTQCIGNSAGHGIMLTKSNLLDEHETWLEHVEHMKEAAAGAPRQADLHEVGFVDPSELARKQTTEARNLVIGRLVAGAGGAGKGGAGVPPTSIPELLNGDMLLVRPAAQCFVAVAVR